jgi:O-antigen ligase
MSRDVLDGACEKAILGLVLVILVFGPLAFGAVDRLPFVVIQGLTALTLVCWGIRMWINARFRFLWPPMCWAVLAFALYAVGRYYFAGIEYVARQELLRVLTYAFLFFVIVNNLHRKESVQIISFSVVFLAMAISCYALYQFIGNSEKVWNVVKAYPHRGSGTYINPNHLAGFLEMVLPVGVAYTLAGRVRPVTRILLGYASLVIAAGIAVTLSRGGWIASGASLLLLFCILATQRAYRIPAGLALLIIVAGCLVLVPKSHFFEKRARQLYSQGRIDDDKRFDLWRPAVTLWEENRWWGIGPGHFDYRFRQVRPESVQLQPERAHNDFLNTLADWGIAGAALIAVSIAFLMLGVLKTWRHVRRSPTDLGDNRHSNKFAFLTGGACGLVAIFLHSAVDFNMHIPANAILATTWAALLSAHLRFATDGHWHSTRPWMRFAGSVALALGVLYLGGQSWQRGAEWCWLRRAARSPRHSPQQANFLTKAFRIEGKNFETAYRIGEAFRRQSQSGGQEYPELEGENYISLANRAMEWYQRAMKLNPWHAYSCLGYGWCLDWLERKEESPPYFARAEELDPNGYFTVANIGVHYVEAGDLAGARPWFERSLRLEPQENHIARNYLALVNTRLLQAATNEIGARLASPNPKPERVNSE